MQNTLHYNFPLFEGEDVPSIIESWNPTMAALDTKLYQLSVGNAGPEILNEITQLIQAVNDLIGVVNDVIANQDNIQDTVNGLQTNVNVMMTTVRNLQREIDDIIAEIPDTSQIEQDISDLQESVGSLDDRVTALEQTPAYTLPVAGADTLGGIKVGNGLSVDQNGVLSNDNPTPAQPYTLPVAGADTLGGIKVGRNLTIEQDGTLNAQGDSFDPSEGIARGTFKFKDVKSAWFDRVGNFNMTLPIGFRIITNSIYSIRFFKMRYGEYDESNMSWRLDRTSIESLGSIMVSYWDSEQQTSVTEPLSDLVSSDDYLFLEMGNLGTCQDVYFDPKDNNNNNLHICEKPKPYGDYAGELVNAFILSLMVGSNNKFGQKTLKKFSSDFSSSMIYHDIDSEQEIVITGGPSHYASNDMIEFGTYAADDVYFGDQYGSLPATWADGDETIIPFDGVLSSNPSVEALQNVSVDGDSSRVSGSDSDYYGTFNITINNITVYKLKEQYKSLFENVI